MNVMKIFIGIPNLGEINSYLSEQLLNLVNKSEHEFEFCFNVKQPTDVNRNIIVNKFLKSNCEYLWFIDSDMLIFDNILDILNSGKKIISPVNLIWQNGLKTNIFEEVLGHTKSLPINNIPILRKADNCGCGCIFIHREIFKKLKQPYFKFGVKRDGITCESENMLFIDKVKKLGYDIYIDERFITGHIKSLDLQSINVENYKWFLRGKNKIEELKNEND